MQNLQCMDYKYSFRDDTTCILGPQKLQCSIGNTRKLNKLTKVSWHISNVHSCNQNNKFLVTTT